MSRLHRTTTLPLLLVASLGIATACADGRSEDEASSAPTPPPPEPTTVERAAPFGNGTLHYLDRGTGEHAVVFVHGWACDSRVWEPELERSPAGRRVIALDLPGHGRSSSPSAAYSMDLFADGITAVLDDAGVARAVLVGHSNGTPSVRQFYRRHPERTLALVAVDGPLRRTFDPSQVQPFLDSFSGQGWQDAVAGFVDSMPTPNLPEERHTLIRQMALAQSQDAVVGGLRAALDDSVWTDDPIDVPLLALLAEQPSWDAEYEAAIRELAPTLDYRVWGDGAGHFLMLERPDEFHRTLDEFLTAHDLL